jgi:3-hydroxyisobutyrate dehydrogenase
MTSAEQGSNDQSVAVLGTGIMGAPMARNLIAAGIPTTVWNRSPSATEELAREGAIVAPTASEAVAGARVVITMLPTAAVVRSVVFEDGAIDAFADGAVWAQMGTIGVEETLAVGDLTRERRPDVLYVDAPVSGSKGAAESRTLLILASGPAEARSALDRPFAAMGRKTMWLGEAGEGSELKLAINAYLAILVEGLAEMLELADHFGIRHDRVIETLQGGPLDAPIAIWKLAKMDSDDYTPEFPLLWALKDVDLAIASAPEAALPSLKALAGTWRIGVEKGHGQKDLSAARLALQEKP